MKPGVRILANSMLLLLALLVAEGLLRVAAAFVEPVDRLLSPPGLSARIPDPVLGWKGRPRWRDHDTRGFRNDRARDSADVVTLGDSHTYGVGVRRSDAWPARLGEESGRIVYNMALGGWGPGEGYLLVREALSLRPQVVMYALYFGNDLVDAFEFASRRPSLRGALPPSLITEAHAREEEGPIAHHLGVLFAMGDTTAPEPGRAPSALRSYLSQHSRLYGLARALRRVSSGGFAGEMPLPPGTWESTLASLTDPQRRFVSVFEDHDWRTLMTAPYRNAAVDDRDPRVEVGIEISELLLARMDAMSRHAGVRFLVLLLPTKETVFTSRSEGRESGPSLDSLVRNESRVRLELVTWLADRGIEHLDLLPLLKASARQPYFEGVDGHPNAVGHQVIADAVARRMGWLPR